MAFSFTAGSSQYLSTGSSPISSVPMTLACMAFCPTGAPSGMLFGVQTASGRPRNVLSHSTPSGGNVTYLAQAVNSSGGNAPSSAAAVAQNTWHHVAGVFPSSASRTAYVNGVAASANTTSIDTGSGMNAILIGARWDTNVGLYCTGRIAEVGIWNVAITADEIASLARGVSPRLIRPQSLVFYAPLLRDLVDVRGGLTITNNNTATVAVHPRIYA